MINFAALTQTEIDEHWMQFALEQAGLAEQKREVPVGAIIIENNQIIGAGYNQAISCSDPTAHAEIMALRNAATDVDNYRLVNCELYVTIEPCTMCAGALIHARIKRLIFGASEPRAGVIISQDRLLDKAYYNHKVDYTHGILSQQCSHLISYFFHHKRNT